MKSPLIDLFDQLGVVKNILNEIDNLKNNKRPLFISKLPGSVKSLLINILERRNDNILIFCPDIQNVNELKVELNILGLSESIIAIDNLNPEYLQEKLTLLNDRKKFILISQYNLINLKLPGPDQIEKSTFKLEVGSEITYDELIEYLSFLNYQKEKFVDSAGDFAVRGSIIDFWSYSEKQPIRVEFDGDFLESIRHFDPDSQRSSGIIEYASLASAISENDDDYRSSIFDYMQNPLLFASEMELRKLFEDTIPESENRVNKNDDMDDFLKIELFDTASKDQTESPVETISQRNEITTLESLFEKTNYWIVEQELDQDKGRIQFNLSNPPIINSNFEILFGVLKDFARKNYQTIITTENEIQGKRLFDLLSDYKIELNELLETGKVKINVLAIHRGFLSKSDKLLVLTDYQIFNKPYRTKIQTKYLYKKSKVKDLASIRKGDYVVHENYGIGQYAGLETLKIGNIEQESIKILYAGGDVVYVNLNYLSLVKKYSSQESGVPKLTSLTSNEWKSTKKKVKAKIKAAARELITLYAKRKASKGIAYDPDTIWQKELEASFFYEDTPDQTKVTEEVKTDMESESPMDRLVCGDVGFGKTEIAIRASFKAVNQGKQAAILVPTTILAEQHYNTFRDRLSQFPVKISSLSRFISKPKQKETLEELKAGTVDIVIGTHRLLSKDINFKDLGLLIIDEEHRFGVMAKEKLRSLKYNIDTLTLTATPIPRTLNMSLLGARDLSIIATPPLNRQPIFTKVGKFDIDKVRSWVLEEIKRDGQIYFVHDRVHSIERIANYIQKHIPEINIGIAHGQMNPAQLEKVIHDFLSKNYHMLISTKIIESGLDIPNVNTIIVNRADRFGLAELHQLRGRVGRSDRQAYAYFLVPSLNTISKKALKRLQAIEEYTDLGEGFNLSMRDLEIRGAGNLLGTEQSGAINSVGFDLYVKMLDEAVEELKQNEFSEIFKDLPKHLERSETKIDTYFEIGIPQSFMPDQADRLGFYSALFSMTKVEEVDEIVEEMTDRFGKIPMVIERLILTAILRFYSSYSLIERIIIQREKIILVLPKGSNESYYESKFPLLMSYILENYPEKIKLAQTKDAMKLEFKNEFNSAEQILKSLIALSKEINVLFSIQLDKKEEKVNN